MQERPATRRIGVAETSDRVEPVANSARNPHRHAVRSQYGYATTMLRLNRRQRDVLADQVPEVANIIMGRCRRVRDRGFQRVAGRTRRRIQLLGLGVDVRIVGHEDTKMTSALLLFGSVVAFAWIIGLLDWLARRRDRKSQQGHV
jgi:hypothetical protein